MSDEKPNKEFHWKNKLEDLESLPGETFNKEAAWDKLHGRMNEKSRNKSTVWYWAAAACLLVVLLIPLFLMTRKERVLVKNNSVQKPIQSTPFDRSKESLKDTSIVISALPAETKSPALSIEKDNKINLLPRPNNIIQPEIIRDKKQKEEFITQKIVSNAVEPVTATINIVANLPEKRKLKVVHVNELGDGVEEVPNIARNYEHRSFQLKLINQEVYTSPPSYGNAGFNIFKTKPTPSN